MKIILLISISLLLTTSSFAQISISESESFPPGIPTRTLIKPQFSDTTLLFYADSLVWNCLIGDGYEYSYFTVDFSAVKSCECYKEVYQKTPINSQYFSSDIRDTGYTYELIEKVKKADLRRTNADEMKYTEFNENGEILRTENLFFDWNNIIATDSSYTENAQLQMSLTVTKLIEATIK